MSLRVTVVAAKPLRAGRMSLPGAPWRRFLANPSRTPASVPLASYGPGSFTLRTQSVTDEDSTRYAQWLQPHGPLLYAGFSARVAPALPRKEPAASSQSVMIRANRVRTGVAR